jgi:hypothetical protein
VDACETEDGVFVEYIHLLYAEYKGLPLVTARLMLEEISASASGESTFSRECWFGEEYLSLRGVWLYYPQNRLLAQIYRASFSRRNISRRSFDGGNAFICR